MADLRDILASLERGEPQASDDLLPLVYDELRRLARAKLSRESPGHTLQPTALVHEAWLRLVGNSSAEIQWNGRAHFFGAAARAIERILVESARRKKSLKHGGEFTRIDLTHVEPAETASVDVLALNEALQKLAQTDPRRAELVRLRYFGGLTLAEAAQLLGVSSSTADNDWAYARAWLRVELSAAEGSPGN